ncbi:MAG TPA: putative aminohydrolase SsnA, partial [Firmicutes bacterium]|nr:putative aminohydrolase SsnA [Bacillota bacterium]
FVLIKRGLIDSVGKMTTCPRLDSGSRPKILDAGGRIVMPGIINTHMHFYSTFARGMSLPGFNPKKFSEVLKGLWWRLDKCLTEDDIYYSALIVLIDAVKKGVTSIIDHHSSPSVIGGSLDIIEEAFIKTGLRSSLCYEVSDRDGISIRDFGIAENLRYLKKVQRKKDPMRSGLFGLHASFTLSDDSLARITELVSDLDTGYHIHTAEGIEDLEWAKKHGYKGVVYRLDNFGILRDKTILVHCIHISDNEIDLIKSRGACVVHNPSSNMNNAVGTAKLIKMVNKGVPIGIGTDGMWVDPTREYVNAYLLQRITEGKPSVGFMESFKAYTNNSLIYNKVTGNKTGQLRKGFAGDVIIKDYLPPTPISEENLIGHFLFGITNSRTDTTICNGKILMEGYKLRLNIAFDEVYRRSNELAKKLWNRISRK